MDVLSDMTVSRSEFRDLDMVFPFILNWTGDLLFGLYCSAKYRQLCYTDFQENVSSHNCWKIMQQRAPRIIQRREAMLSTLLSRHFSTRKIAGSE